MDVRIAHTLREMRTTVSGILGGELKRVKGPLEMCGMRTKGSTLSPLHTSLSEEKNRRGEAGIDGGLPQDHIKFYRIPCVGN